MPQKKAAKKASTKKLRKAQKVGSVKPLTYHTIKLT
jgi:hypothetical protein